MKNMRRFLAVSFLGFSALFLTNLLFAGTTDVQLWDKADPPYWKYCTKDKLSENETKLRARFDQEFASSATGDKNNVNATISFSVSSNLASHVCLNAWFEASPVKNSIVFEAENERQIAISIGQLREIIDAVLAMKSGTSVNRSDYDLSKATHIDFTKNIADIITSETGLTFADHTPGARYEETHISRYLNRSENVFFLDVVVPNGPLSGSSGGPQEWKILSVEELFGETEERQSPGTQSTISFSSGSGIHFSPLP